MVDTTEVNFGKVKFIQSCSQTLAIANNGQVPVQFEFIHKPGEESYCKPWLQAEPYSGFIMPGTAHFYVYMLLLRPFLHLKCFVYKTVLFIPDLPVLL